MGGVDPRTVEAAWRAVHFARRAAQQANRAAAQAATAAAHRERLMPDAPEELAELRARVAAMERRSEACQRTAERLLSNFARRLERWAAREDAAEMLRPVLMREVARTAGWGGVVLTLRDRSGAEVLVAASDERARRVHELEVALDEGPSVEASLGRTSIAYGEELEVRWPRFGEIAWELGVHAVAALPLDSGPAHAGGSLSGIGPPMPAQRGDLRGLRKVAGALDEGVLRTSDLVCLTDTELPSLEMFESEDFQPTLHQAAGVLFAQKGWEVGGAIALIRAHAYAEDRSVAEVAEDILAGRLWSA